MKADRTIRAKLFEAPGDEELGDEELRLPEVRDDLLGGPPTCTPR